MQTLRVFPLAAVLALAACSPTPPTGKTEETKAAAKKEAEKLDPISGQTAFFRMYTQARTWAADAQGLSMRSIHLPDVAAEPGKSGAWEAVFVSESGRRARTYTWSAVESEGNLHQGVFAGQDQSWGGARGTTRPFSFQAIKKDTVEAYKTAVEKGKGAAEYVKKNPGKHISILLEQSTRHPDPAWRILWGESVSTSNYSVFIDATTGLYLETMR